MWAFAVSPAAINRARQDKTQSAMILSTRLDLFGREPVEGIVVLIYRQVVQRSVHLRARDEGRGCPDSVAVIKIRAQPVPRL